MLHQDDSRKSVEAKPAYTAPTMSIYGSVIDLTAGGSGAGTEPGTAPACNTSGSNATKLRC